MIADFAAAAHDAAADWCHHLANLTKHTVTPTTKFVSVTLPINRLMDSVPLCENMMSSTKLKYVMYCILIIVGQSRGNSQLT